MPKNIFKFVCIACFCLFLSSSVTPLAYAEEKIEPAVALAPLTTPDKVKGIYLTGTSFTIEKIRNKHLAFLDRTIINSLVIDIADSAGSFMFKPEDARLKKLPVSKLALTRDNYIKLLNELQEKNIYTIARVVTFQDSISASTFPSLALKTASGKVWRNFNNVAWLDMTDREAWEIPLAKAREAIALGFDEVQFDYIRFPSDGNIGSIRYKNFPKDGKTFKVLGEFFKYTSEQLSSTSIPLSVDLFGLTYRKYKDPEYALGIGQRIADAAPYFDYLSPMVYPSHYGAGHFGLKSPVNSPYELVKYSMQDGNKILAGIKDAKAKSRPWLQDFNMGAVYTPAMVKAQIRAADENNTAGWLLWNAGNNYTEAALKE